MVQTKIKSPQPYTRVRASSRIDWSQYDPGDFYDEIIGSPGRARSATRSLVAFKRKQTIKRLVSKQQAADLAIQEMGISFTIYSEGQNIDRSWPMDIIPRVIPLHEWQVLEFLFKKHGVSTSPGTLPTRNTERYEIVTGQKAAN